MADLAVIILTGNEERHIERAIASIRGIAAQIFVVDSLSTDNTVAIAAKGGATVLSNPFVSPSRQFQWAMVHTPITAGWVMRLDADEIIEPDLAREIERQLPLLGPDVNGVNLKRKHIFMDRWVRHGGRYPLVLLRIWRRGSARVEDRWMDEHMIVESGRIVTLEGGFCDHNLNDLSFFTNKHNQYATREAIEVINRRLRLFPTGSEVSVRNSSAHTALKRIIMLNVYNRIPFTMSATLYFLWRYFFRLGFLDGRSGLTYHFLQGYWYRFLVGAKVMELERAIEKCTGKDEIIGELSRLTNLNLVNHNLS